VRPTSRGESVILYGHGQRQQKQHRLAAIVNSFALASGDVRYALWVVAGFFGLAVLGGLLQAMEIRRDRQAVKAAGPESGAGLRS
jgi:hypothetical protein